MPTSPSQIHPTDQDRQAVGSDTTPGGQQDHGTSQPDADGQHDHDTDRTAYARNSGRATADATSGATADATSGAMPGESLTTPRRRFSRTRTIVFTVFVLAVCTGLAIHTGFGTVSAFGWDLFSAICPLGALETLLAGHQLVARLIIGVVVALVIVLFVGKALCAWLCPVPHLRHALAPKKQLQNETAERQRAAQRATQRWKDGETAPHRKTFDSRHVVLAGALGSSLVFGFPVFCLICPVGLTFGELILFWRLVQFNQWSWAIIVFPLIVVFEVLVFKRWCHTLCPIGALMSLVAHGNRTLRPTVKAEGCLKDEGKACDSCARACPEHIDVSTGLGERPMNECIKCGRCVEACPASAIAFRLAAGSSHRAELRDSAVHSHVE